MCLTQVSAVVLYNNTYLWPSQGSTIFIVNKTIHNASIAKVNETCIVINSSAFCNETTNVGWLSTITIIITPVNGTFEFVISDKGIEWIKLNWSGTVSQVQYSTDNITWTNLTSVGLNEGYQINLQPSKKYYFRGKNTTTEWAYLSQNTKVDGETTMASLSVTLFVGAITFILFFIGLRYDLSKNPFTNLVLKRCLVLFAMLLLSLDTTMIATMADNASLGITQEIFRYLWLINWTIYLLMVWLVISTILNGLKLWRVISEQKRMGDYENDQGRFI